MKLKEPVVSLTGGLGNQLFQLAAGKYFFKQGNVLLEWGIGKPRLNNKNMPELASFALPPHIRFLNRRKKLVWLMSKSTGYQLRMGVSPRPYERNPFVRKLILHLGMLISCAYFCEKRSTFVSQTLGFTSELPEENAVFVIGYFQSYRWLLDPKVLEMMQAIKPITESAELDFYKELSVEEKPLVVHVRLGDYKGSKDFGVLTPKYYVDLAQKMMETNQYGKIWVFSDEIEVAKLYFAGFSSDSIRYIEEIDSSAAHTFEVMRYGSGYIISNSTFSWWAASLSYTTNPNVIAPTPWFKGMGDPQELIPPTWVCASSVWEK